jgi:hypothetical protein
LATPLNVRWSRSPSSPASAKRLALSEFGDHEEPESGLRVLGLSTSGDQAASRRAIEPGYLVHGKVLTIGVGLATTTIDGSTFPFNVFLAIRTLSGDLESRTVV